MKCAINIPSIKDGQDHYKDFIDKMIPSMEFLQGLKDTVITINFQLYSSEECEQIAEDIESISGLEVRYIERDYSGQVVPMRLIRHECAMLAPEADLVIFTDDNFRYKDGTVEMYEQVVKYFEENPACGWLQCTGHLGGYMHEDEVVPKISSYWWTDRSFFVRSLKESAGYILYPEEVLEIPSAYEEIQCLMHRLEEGYHGAKVYNSPIIHHKSTVIQNFDDQKDIRTPVEYDVHNPAHFQTIYDYFKKRWGPLGKWVEDKRTLPKGVVKLFEENCRNPAWREASMEW